LLQHWDHNPRQCNCKDEKPNGKMQI